MRILVTGASGFIGRQILKDLSVDAEVIAVVRSAGELNSPYETLLISKIDGQTNWEGKLVDVDVVVHLAARVHVMKETAADPLTEFRAVNTEGTRLLAEQATKQGVKRFIFVSSIAVNGKGTENSAYSASDSPAPIDAYGISKWEAEQAIQEISRNTGLEVVIIRPPVVYGPAAKGNIGKLLKLVKTGIPLPFGSVDNRRSMISLQNLSIWIRRTIFDDVTPESPILVADPRPVSTKELVMGIAEGLGRKIYLFPIRVSVMRYFAWRIRKENLVQQLCGNLEIIPTYEALPGIKTELFDPAVELPKISWKS